VTPSPRAALLRELIGDALTNLYDLRRRSLLALIGVVIGTASVVAMLSIGLIAAAPLMVGHIEIDVGHAFQPIGVAAVTPDLADLAGLRLARGRFITAFDGPALVAIIGAGAAAKLSRSGLPLDIGARVPIGRYLFSVVGILVAAPTTGFDPTDYNEAVLIPLADAHRALGATTLNAALARVRPGSDAIAAAGDLDADLKRITPRAQIQVQSAQQLVQMVQAQKAVQTRLLAAIGGISLLVGGIGVMNVMLMNVMERRREIGLRAAIGASPREIQIMFLVEAAALALVGGIAGTGLGIAASAVVATASGWHFSLALYAIPLGSGIATLVGLAFGLYPAVTASHLDPIEALRAE
jgi:putative ABC transport system permease protein